MIQFNDKKTVDSRREQVLTAEIGPRNERGDQIADGLVWTVVAHQHLQEHTVAKQFVYETVKFNIFLSKHVA